MPWNKNPNIPWPGMPPEHGQPEAQSKKQHWGAKTLIRQLQYLSTIMLGITPFCSAWVLYCVKRLEQCRHKIQNFVSSNYDNAGKTSFKKEGKFQVHGPNDSYNSEKKPNKFQYLNCILCPQIVVEMCLHQWQMVCMIKKTSLNILEAKDIVPWRLFGGLFTGKEYSTPFSVNFPSLIRFATRPTIQP